MKVKHMLPKGMRYNCSSVKNINKRSKFHRIPIYSELIIIGGTKDLWWCPKLRRWTTIKEAIENRYSYQSWVNVNSVRAAKAHVRRHNEIPKGTKLILCSNFVGCDVYITK